MPVGGYSVAVGNLVDTDPHQPRLRLCHRGGVRIELVDRLSRP